MKSRLFSSSLRARRPMVGLGLRLVAAALLLGYATLGAQFIHSEGASGSAIDAGGESPGPRNVELAECGPESYPEAALEGWVPNSDPSYIQRGYRCNLELVGQLVEDGMSVSASWYGHCAYLDSGYLDSDPVFDKYKGVKVIDASDPAHPILVQRLQTEGMETTLETLQIHQERGLMAAARGTEGGGFWTPGSPAFDIYDLKGDCAHPRLLFSGDMFDPPPHGSGFSGDGRTFYGTGSFGMQAIDISDPTDPRKIADWNPAETDPRFPAFFHRAHFAPGDPGNTAFLPVFTSGQSEANGWLLTSPRAGLMIADVSEIQARQPNPRVRPLRWLSWTDGINAMTAPVGRIRGRTYAFTSDEFGSKSTVLEACANGLPPFGFIHVIDATDPSNARQVSTIRMQVNDPANCPELLADPLTNLTVGYSPHMCVVDKPVNTTALACSWESAGVRVFDVRDPLHPREIAYFNPPPRPETPTTAGWGGATKPVLAPSPFRDPNLPEPRFYRGSDGTWQLWTASEQNGLMILRFTNGAYPLT
jgi:hypothetical protein